jgi:predicted RNA polymerase sigma factor
LGKDRFTKRHTDSDSSIRPSPIVALNLAIAVAQRDGSDRGIEEIRAIEDRERPATYPFYSAALPADCFKSLHIQYCGSE